jgi:hypothetical protein
MLLMYCAYARHVAVLHVFDFVGAVLQSVLVLAPVDRIFLLCQYPDRPDL